MTIQDELDSDARFRERYSWQHRRLRWAVLEGLAAESAEFSRATKTLADDNRVALRLLYHEMTDAERKVNEALSLPKRLRPPKEWRDIDWFAYLSGLARLCRWFGLTGRVLPERYSQRPDGWDEALHYFLQHLHGTVHGTGKRLLFGHLYVLEMPLPSPLPWTDEPPRRRGRPAIRASNPSSQEFREWEVLAQCIARRLLGQSWEEITDTCDLTTRKGFELTPLELATRCRRLAKRLKIYRPL